MVQAGTAGEPTYLCSTLAIPLSYLMLSHLYHLATAISCMHSPVLSPSPTSHLTYTVSLPLLLSHCTLTHAVLNLLSQAAFIHTLSCPAPSCQCHLAHPCPHLLTTATATMPSCHFPCPLATAVTTISYIQY